MMARRLARILLGLGMLFSGMAQAALLVGVPPIHDMRTLAARYEPLRSYLENQLAQPVRLESAPDFMAYHTRTLRGDFDLTVTPAHFARLAEKKRHFQPIVQFMPDHEALLIYSTKRPLSLLARLKGEQLAVIDRHAITVMATLHDLKEHGLVADRDFSVVEYRNHASVAQAVSSGRAIAGITASHSLQQVSPALRAQLRILTPIRGIPAFVMLLKPDSPENEVTRMKSLLLAFARNPDGQTFMQGIGYSALVAAEESQLKRVDAYLKDTAMGLAQ